MAIYMWREYVPQPITTPGIYWNETDGLISLSSDGSNWYTIMDKNLGATTVYNNGDTLSEANCGKYYQWGNNYGFPRTGSVTTSSTSRVNAQNYGPSNYYNSSTFIKQEYWDSSNNTNLRGDTTDTSIARKGPCPTGFHIPSQTEANYLVNTIMISLFSDLWSNGKPMRDYLKMPFSGQRQTYSDAYLRGQGTVGSYWTSTAHPSSSQHALCLEIREDSVRPQSSAYAGNRGFGFSIRPLKDEAVQPYDSRTVLYQ